MVKRTFALLCLIAGPALVASCSGSGPTLISTTAGTSAVGAEECVTLTDAVSVANTWNLGQIAARGGATDSKSYPYAYTEESTRILACDGGVTLIDTGLRDSNNEPVPTELHRYLIERNSNGEWYNANSNYTVEVGDRFVGMDCAKLPPKVAAQYSVKHPSEPVTYPSRACAPTSTEGTPTEPPAPSVSVGEVPGQPHAAAALRAWATDLVAGDMAELVRNCWTIAPERVRTMYADTAAIKQAIAQPGIDGQFAYIWQNATTRVGVKRSEIASGYACPYVSPQSDVHIYNAEDARYLVMRFVMRVIGAPVNVNDTEARYPLECHELTDTSRSIAATTTAFDQNSIEVTGGPDEWQVFVQGTSSDGEDRQYRYITGGWDEGYCVAVIE